MMAPHLGQSSNFDKKQKRRLFGGGAAEYTVAYSAEYRLFGHSRRLFGRVNRLFGGPTSLIRSVNRLFGLKIAYPACVAYSAKLVVLLRRCGRQASLIRPVMCAQFENAK